MEVLQKLIDTFNKKDVEFMHFNSWQFNVDDCYMTYKGEEILHENNLKIIYHGFNSHDCCSQFT
ncbi:MAG: hypothetical protein ACRCST_03100, partial [Turicibacter sp.]